MTQSFRTVENWADYTFGCPDGKWTARLDNKAWGKGKVGNIILYFSEVGTGSKYWLSVFWDNGYCPDDESLSFRDVEPGAVLELTTAKTKNGKPRLLSAVMPELIEVRERRRQKLRYVLQEVEALWNETAPCGEGFTVEKGLELLLYDLRRYQAAVAGIFEKEQEHRALLDHKTATGQECEADRQRWLAYLEMTHAITALAASPK